MCPRPAFVKEGQFKGMDISSALEAYLHERGGRPIEIEKIAQDLEIAGVKLGKTRPRYIINLRITASNNRAFRYADHTKRAIGLAY
jgi:hypothetical protein